MRMALPAPKSRTSPYMPDKTYATASPIVISTPSNFWAPFLPTTHDQSRSEQDKANMSTDEDPSCKTNIWRNVLIAIITCGCSKKWGSAAIFRQWGILEKSTIGYETDSYKRARSSLTLLSTSMSLEPASSCMTSPDVTMGVIPSSMTVPRLDARMTRIQ